MSVDYRYFPALAIPGGTTGQVLTKASNDPDNGAQWADPQVGVGPQGPPGPAGPVGPAGAAGTPGAAGSVWYEGSGLPAGGLGVVGDYYFDVVTNNVYTKTGASTWTFVAQFGSPTGAPAGTADEYGYRLPGGGCSSLPVRPIGKSDTLASSTLWITYFRAPSSFTTTQVRTRAVVAATGQTLARIGLYTADFTTGDLTALVASTANDTTLWNTGNAFFTRSWSSSYALVRDTWYAVAVLSVGGTPPDIYSLAAVGASVVLSPRATLSVTGQANLPATVTPGVVSGSAFRVWAEIQP